MTEARENDWFLYTGETGGGFVKGKVYYLQGGEWLESYDPRHYSEAMTDLLALNATGVAVPKAQNFIDNLVTNNLTIQNNNSGIAPVEGDLKQISTAGGIRFYKYLSGDWVEVGGFNGDNIQFEPGNASIVLAYDGMPISSTAENCVIIGNIASRNQTAGNSCIYIGYGAGEGDFQGLTGVTNTGDFNIGIGRRTLGNNQTGFSNTGVGGNALLFNTTGFQNIAIGVIALLNNTIGNNNTAVGPSACSGCLSGNNNVGVGTETLNANTSGSENTALGFFALNKHPASTRNVAIGALALHQAVDGQRICAVGVEAGAYAQGDDSVYLGTKAGRGAFETNGGLRNIGIENIGLGPESLYSNTIGIRNVSVGYKSAFSNTEGNNNISIGVEAAYNKALGSNNVSIGYQTLFSATSAASNVALGTLSLNNATATTLCVAIGYEALSRYVDGSPATAMFACTGIGPDTRVSGDNQVQLGNSSAPYSQTVYAASAITVRSDIRDKADIKPTSFGLNFINKLEPVEYRYDYRDDYIIVKDDGTVEHLPKDGSKKRKRFHQGFIAQQVKQVADEIGVDFSGYLDSEVNGGCDVKSLKYEYFIAPMVRAIQELTATVQFQQKAIEDLQAGQSKC
jgi:hypothetical protein